MAVLEKGGETAAICKDSICPISCFTGFLQVMYFAVRALDMPRTLWSSTLFWLHELGSCIYNVHACWADDTAAAWQVDGRMVDYGVLISWGNDLASLSHPRAPIRPSSPGLESTSCQWRMVWFMPTINIESTPYILRSCLTCSKEPADFVKSIDDDLKALWKRLDEKWGDSRKVVDAIINTTQNMRNIRDGENNRLIKLINVIEDGYQDLKRLGLGKEITTTSSVSVIEQKLPTDVKKEWENLVSSDHSTVDKMTTHFRVYWNSFSTKSRPLNMRMQNCKMTRNKGFCTLFREKWQQSNYLVLET